MQEKIKARLKSLGVSPKLKGYQYAADAVEMLIAQDKAYKITELYRAVAELNNSTSNRVERAIRHAVGTIDHNAEAAKTFDAILHYEKSKPTNSDFLFTIADEFKKPPHKPEPKKAEEQTTPATQITAEPAHITANISEYLSKDNTRIEKLISDYPVNLTTSAISDFLQLDIASVRALVENGVIGMSWRKPGKANHGYFIPTAQFVRWYLHL